MAKIKNYNAYLNDENISREMRKLHDLGHELFSPFIKKLIDSNNLEEIKKFIKFFEDTHTWCSSNQFLHQHIYSMEHDKEKYSDVKDVDIDYDDLLKKIEIYKEQQQIVQDMKDAYK